MKTLRFLILGLFATATVCSAQITSPGWFNVQSLTRPAPTVITSNMESQLKANLQFSPLSQPGEPSTPIAEAITPQIQALADGLQDNPVRIFNYVHDHINHVFYFGSKKGAELTLLEKSGNDFDQCALLMALLRAAGYTNAQYQFGWMLFPYDIPDGSDRDLHHWLQLTLTNSNWLTTSNYLADTIYYRGYPTYAAFWGNNVFAFQHVWVILPNGSTTNYLDPSFKVYEPVSGINLASAMGFNSNTLASVAGGTDTGTYVSGLNEAGIRNTLSGYTTNLLNYLQNNYPNASPQQILGGWQVVDSTNTTLPTSQFFTTSDFGGALPIQTWTYEPTNMMSQLTITFAQTIYHWFMPQFEGQRLSLTYDSSGLAQLWQDDTLLAQHSTTASDTNVILYAQHPVGYWNPTNNTFVDTGAYDQITTNAYQRTNATYVLTYAFEPDWGWLQERENQLDAYRQKGLANNSRQVVSETLNILGLSWMLQTEGSQQLLCQQLNILPMNYHRLGRVAQVGGNGYYVDAYMEENGDWENSGVDATSLDHYYREFELHDYFSSALESGVIEQLQNTNLPAASTIKMLEIANTNGQAVYMAYYGNWSSIVGSLANYSTGTLNSIYNNYIQYGYFVMLPQNGANAIAGTGSWKGYGYLAFGNSLAMIISGGYNGGYSAYSGSTADPTYIDTSGDNQPQYYASTPTLTPNPLTADPVDTADDTFQLEHTDLSLGQAAPRGITLTRYYNGTRRFSNPSGMAGGWVNNYTINANTVAAPQAGLGGTTPAQMAAMLVASTASINFYNDNAADPGNWMTIALIAKWGIDQLDKNGVSVNLGKDTLQFVKQPNGVFTPPANCTAALTQSSGAYALQMRHGNKFNFNTSGLLSSIVDQYGQTMNLTYNASNWVSTVKDWQNRNTLTFTYTGTPLRLTSVSDGTRTADYSYSTAYNSQGDLTSFTDAEGQPSYYTYDTNHDITATLDAQSRLVISNVYNSQGRLTTQYTQGDTNKTWRLFWSGWATVENDPANDISAYFYDDEGRLTSTIDPLQHSTEMIYDGQNHVIYTISPLLEISQSIYDGNNNLIETIDPLGFTNQFVFDSNNNLIRSVDGRSDVSTFGYNAEFSLTGRTNGAGDWVNYSYTTSGANAGTLASRTDPGGTTQYGYDSYGLLNSITYPNGLGGESFVNNSLGEVTSHTDGNGNVTAFQYNNRLELTNTIAPTNVVTSVAFDANDNVASATDARGNTTTNTWSVTRQLLTTTLPTVVAGTPVMTRSYDNRDWLSESLDPLDEPTFYTNNADHWLISQSDPLQRTTSFGFDADGRKIAITNASQEVTSQSWNAKGEQIQLTDGANHTSLRAYDGAGNQITLTNRNGNVWRFQFDGANRLTNTITPLNRTMSQTWNHQGLLSTVADPMHQTTYLYYDGKNRLTNRTDNTGTTLYTFDGNDNRTSARENGLTNSWTFDAYNRVSTYKDAYGNLIQYKYDSAGNLTNLVYPGGKNVYYTFDNDNHLIQVKDWAGRITSFQYDLTGRLTKITRPNGTFRTLSYDSAGELTNIWEQMANGLPIAWLRHNWNPNSTMNWEFAAPLPHTNSLPTRNMTYNDDNELSTVDGSPVTEDNDGNLTYGPLTNDNNFVSFAFDARNRLLNAGGVTNIYDAMNNRIGQTYGTNSVAYMVNPNATLPQVLMSIKNGVTNYYVYGAGLLYQVTETPSGEKTLTYHYDYRGSTIALTDDSGVVVDRFEYSLYATLTYRAGTDDTPFLFNGRYGVMSDPNGLLYMNARYYSPYICRFLSPDPTGFSGGLNFYAYADLNPASYLDPFGVSAVGDYFEGVGQVFEGYGLAIGGTATGIYNAATHPINAAVGLYNVAANPVQAYNAISTSVANTWNSGLEGQGQIVGNILIAAGTIGSGAAVASTRAAAIAAAEPELTEGMSTLQILTMYDQGSQALNAADYAAYGYDLQDLSPAGNLYRGMLMQQGVDIGGNAYEMTTTFGERMTTAAGLWNTGLTPSAAIVPGILGGGAETVGWLGNTTTSSSTGK